MNKEYDNPNQLYSKWRTANKALMDFNDIYINVTSDPQSDANEVDVLSNVRKIYKAKFIKLFGNEAF